MAVQKKFQIPGSPVDIGPWTPDEDHAVFPVGSKPKRLVICPENNGKPYLIPGHPYLFKTAEGWKERQLWSEVIAYRIAALVGLDVPPCFVAVDGRTGQRGALVEFFYGYPGDPNPPRLIPAADWLQRVQPGARTDRPHSVRTNISICRGLGLDGVDWWSRLLAFDALIGNTDRHPENWGFLVRISPGVRPEVAFAPAFDNGTSLGYQIAEARIRRASEPEELEAFIDRGKHHCSWDLSTDSMTPHMLLCERMAATYPEAGAAMKKIIDFDSGQIVEIVDQCTAFDVGVLFSPDRARFVSALVDARKRRLSTIVGE